MRVEYAPEQPLGSGDASQLARNCHLAVAIVRAAQKSRCLTTANGFLVSTAGVRDASGDENPNTVTIHGYCSVGNLLDFAMEAEYFMKQLKTLGMRAELQQSGGHKPVNELTQTPDSAKKCRILDVLPVSQGQQAELQALQQAEQKTEGLVRQVRDFDH